MDQGTRALFEDENIFTHDGFMYKFDSLNSESKKKVEDLTKKMNVWVKFIHQPKQMKKK